MTARPAEGRKGGKRWAQTYVPMGMWVSYEIHLGVRRRLPQHLLVLLEQPRQRGLPRRRGEWGEEEEEREAREKEEG